MAPDRIKPSQRERKRYVLVHVHTDETLPASYADDLTDAINDCLGLLDAAKATVFPAATYPETGHVILRVAHTHRDSLIRCVASIDELLGYDATVTTQVTSGTIKQVKTYYAEHVQDSNR